MRILYIHQYYKIPEEGGAIRSYHFAKSLAEAGHKVTVITSTNKKIGEEKNVEGVRVIYLPVSYSNYFNFFQRVIAFLKFFSSAYREVKKQRSETDLVFATSTPLTVGALALIVKKRLGLKYYFEARDLWPEVPVKLGIIRNELVISLLYALEKKIYQCAEKIIVLSPESRNYVKAKTGKESILLPNFSDCEFYFPEKKSPELENKYRVAGKFVISYLGTIGKANHLEYLIKIAKTLEELIPGKTMIVIAGDGVEKKKIMRLKDEFKLTNVLFVEFAEKRETKNLMNVSDATYTSFLNNKVLESSSPNKFFDSLAAGKLTIVNTKGWLKDLVEKNKAGFYVDPDLPGDFSEKLKVFIANPSHLEAYQKNARALALEKFDKKKILEEFKDHFKD